MKMIIIIVVIIISSSISIIIKDSKEDVKDVNWLDC